MKNNVLITFPNEVVKKGLWNNKDLIILDDYGFWVYDGSSGKRKLKKHPIEYEDLSKVRDELNWWSPIFDRWISESFMNEYNRIKSLILINQIIFYLKKYEIKHVILMTGVVHHLQDILISISCQKLNVIQLYLYSNVIDGRLLVLKQKGNIFEREIFMYKKNEHKYEKKIESFLENLNKGYYPKSNTKISGYKTSYIIALLILNLRGLKKIFSFKKKKNNAKIFQFEENILGFASSLKIVRRQNQFLKKYVREALTNEEFHNKTKNKKTLLIAAHYQPEATSFPEGGNYSNHIEIIHKLRSIGYKDDLFYKEHPGSKMYIDPPSIFLTKVSIYKNLEFIKQIKEYNCFFLNFDFKITKNTSTNYIPITIGGTLAIERALNGYKTIICGLPWFKDMPGLIHLDSIQDKKEIDELTLEYDKKIEISAKKYLLKVFNKNTFLNPYCIGTSKKIDDDISLGLEEFNKLIEHLKK
ncbi:MAG: hypothetical protein VX325_04395 [Bacteroidota bacterium]|nr:hypothetical protein [Bacteroidota bacterium]